MAHRSIDELQSILRLRVRHFLSDNAPEKRGRRRMFRRIVESGWPAFLLGGTLRDILIHGSWVKTRDVDVVVGDVTNDDLLRISGSLLRRRTRFGGLHIDADGCPFDLWTLASTWAFKEYPHKLGGEFCDLPRTTFLDIEAIAMELPADSGRPRLIYHASFFESYLSRVVELNFEPNPFPHLAVVRSLVTVDKIRFGIGPRLASYIVHYARQSSPEELYAVQLSHYGHPIFTVEQIARRLALIRDRKKWSPRRPVLLPFQQQLELFNYCDRSTGSPS